MPAILRYHTKTPLSMTPIIMSFPTEAGMKQFCQNSLPADAQCIDMWWEDDTPKQQPTCRPEWLKPTAWEQETGKRVPIITCPIEITRSTRALRRADMAGRSTTVPHLTTGYVAKMSPEKELSWEALEKKWTAAYYAELDRVEALIDEAFEREMAAGDYPDGPYPNE